ncbi:MAG: hypothetical protein IKV15_05590 [Bacteroidaceae bacterium]|nr:hypothetical protein [Bacteroidaceae bacterium]
MKRNYRNLFMVGMMAIAACFTGCKEKDAPFFAASIAGNEQIAEEIRSTSASFTLKTENIETVAYLVEEGTVSESSKDAAVLYIQAEEEGRVVTVADGDNTINVYSLEGGKEYTIFFVYKKDGELVITSKVFTTPAYDRIITVVETKKEGFKFHFNVPDTMTYMYAFLPTEQYNSFRSYGWADDVTFLLDGRTCKGPQTVEINTEEDWLYEGDGGFYIHPGAAFTLMIAECDAEGNLLFEENPDYQGGWGGGWGPLAAATRAGTAVSPRVGDYTEEARTEDEFYPTGLYARQNLYAALTMVDSKINVELTGKTERRIKLRCTTEDDVQYVVAPYEKAMYEQLVDLVTEQAVATTLLEYYGTETYSGTQDFEIDENILYLEVDSTYIISVVGIYAEDASVISYDTLHVTLTKSTAPAAEVTITAGTNPEGEVTPDLVWFNIKSEKKNVYAAKHIANYTKEVQKMLNQGYTYEELLSWYGGDLTEEDIQAINSDEGLTLCIASMEDMESTLIIGAYNEEDGLTVSTGVSRSAALPALPEAPEYNAMSENLKGEWTARIIEQKSETFWMSDETMENWWTVDSVWVDTTYTTITLGNNFDNSPANFDETDENYSVAYDSHYYNAIENGATEQEADDYAKAQVAAQFAQYKEMVTKYENKYKSQNFILGLGLDALHPFATPWDLFCSADYVAYDVEEIFYAYGPKLFFQVQEDGSLFLMGDATVTYLPPVAGWNYYDVLLMGYNPTYANEGMYYTASYPVEVSDDKNTIVIKGIELEGEYFYPALGSSLYGWPEFFTKTCEDIVLTRGTANAAATRAAKVELDNSKLTNAKSNRIKRSYIPTEMVKVKTSKVSYVNVSEKIQEKYKKQIESLRK